jgi:hypothetical protein
MSVTHFRLTRLTSFRDGFPLLGDDSKGACQGNRSEEKKRKMVELAPVN